MNEYFRTLEKFTEDRIPVEGEMKQVLLCYMLPQQKKTQEFVLRRSVIESVDIKLMQKEEHHRGSRLSGMFQFSSHRNFRRIDFFEWSNFRSSFSSQKFSSQKLSS